MVLGAGYDGHFGTRTYAELVTQRGRRRLERFAFAFLHASCNDGGSYAAGLGGRIAGGRAITAGGLVSYSRTYAHTYAFNRRGARVPGSVRIAFTAQFSGKRVNGTLRERFTGRGLTCSIGTRSFVAFLDGGTQAPLRNASVTTGHYAGESSDEVQGAHRNWHFSMTVFVPWAAVTSMRFRWQEHCGHKAYIETAKLGLVPLHSGHGVETFSQRRGGKRVLPHGVSERYSYDLRGQFYKKRTYRFVGAWTFTANYFRGKDFLGSCSGDTTIEGQPT